MTKKKKSQKIFYSLMLNLALLYGLYRWFLFRSNSIVFFDFFWIALGIASVLWIYVWQNSKLATKTSLIVPWGPIFITLGIGIVGNNLGLISDMELLNIMILYWCGFIEGTLTSSLISLLFFSNKEKAKTLHKIK